MQLIQLLQFGMVCTIFKKKKKKDDEQKVWWEELEQNWGLNFF